MKLLKILFSFFIIIVFLNISAQTDFQEKIKQNEKKLGEIKKQLNSVKSKKDSINIQRSKTLLVLNRMDDEIYLTDLLINEMERRDSLLTTRITILGIEIDSLEIELVVRKEALKKRIVSLYKKGKIHTFEIMFTSKSFSDLSNRLMYLSTLAKQDKKLYDKVFYTQNILNRRINEMSINREQLKIIRDEAENEKETLQIEKQNKQIFLNKLSGEQQKQRKLEKELIKSKESLQYLINKLRVANTNINKNRDVKKGQHYFDKNKKKVICPASGKVISKFGTVRHPKYNTKTLNNGIDIKVKKGEPVYAVCDGDVIYADKFLGYGNVIMLDHGNGYFTLYAHLEEMNVILNQPVMNAEAIGTCGDTGSLSGAILHFEIRKDGKPLNPSNYLK